jgi:ATP/maltotriose-dependent transcriptional regulator MalT
MLHRERARHGRFGQCRTLQRAEWALRADGGPDIRLRLHLVTGMLHAGRGRHQKALEEFGAAERFGSQLVSPLTLASRVTGWLLATQARLGMTGAARGALAALDDERALSGEIGNNILDIMRGASVRHEDPLVRQQVEQLGRSELKVLRYLPTNLSRPEIAAELSVSVNTVSTHIRSIYGKLGAADRSAAVRCARDLRLLAVLRS